MEQNDYMALLKQARANLPQNVGNKERWALPRPDVIIEGRMTLLRNFKEMTVDTHGEKDARTSILRCEACGAHTPIKARKARRPEAAVKEGGTYEVRLMQPGQRGEGKGSYEGYIFIVPGGQVGQTVWARVNKLSGKMAFAELSQKPKD